MNKKFSTLVAVLLAAGSFVTVSAVVEILEGTPKTGESYAIGTTLDGKATLLKVGEKVEAVDEAESSTLSGVADETDITKLSKWTLIGDVTAEAGATLVLVDGDALRYLSLDTEGALELIADAAAGSIVKVKLDTKKLIVVGGDSKEIKLDGATVSLVATGQGSDLVFFAEAETEVAAPVADTKYCIGTSATLADATILTGTYTAAVSTPAYYPLSSEADQTIGDATKDIWTVTASGEGFTLSTEAGTVCANSNGDLIVVADADKASFTTVVFKYVNGELTTTIGEAKEFVLADGNLVTATPDAKDNAISFSQWADDAAPETPGTPGAGITAEPTTTTPVLVKLGTNYLIASGDSVATIAASDWKLEGANAVAASWYVSTDGLYKSIANGKYLKAKPAPAPALRADAEPVKPAVTKELVLTADKAEATRFVAFASAGTPVTAGGLVSMTALGYGSTGAYSYISNTGTLSATYSNNATLGVSSLVERLASNNVLTTFDADFYYLLSVDGTNFIASADGQTTVTNATGNMAALWKVAESAAPGGFNYKFTNANGDELKLDGVGNFASANGQKYATTGAVQLTVPGKNIVAGANGAISATAGGTLATFGLFTAPENLFSADLLTAVLGGGFDLTIAMKSDYTVTDIKNNPFTGILTPMTVSGSKLVPATTGSKYLLKNSADEYIVLDTKSAYSTTQAGMNGENSQKRGYKFTTLSEEDFTALMFGTDLTAAEWKAMKEQYNPYFSVACQGDPSKTIKGLLINVYDYNQNFFGKLYTADFDEENVLTTSNAINSLDNTRTENWPYIKFGGNGLVASSTFFGKALNVEYVHSGAHGQAKNNQDFTTAGRRVDAQWTPVDTIYTQFDKPEGQWMVSVSNNPGEFTLINRESQAQIDLKGLYKTPVANVYAAVTVTGYSTELVEGKWVTKSNSRKASSSANDTLQITIAPAYVETTGYANLDTTSLKVKTFTMAVATALDGNVYSTEPDNGHKIGLSKDVEDAAQWRLIKFELGNKVKNKPYNAAKNDTIKSFIDIYNDKNEVIATDSLYAFAYAFRNDATNEFLKYDADKKAFIVDKDSKNWTVANYDAVDKFILKEERGGTYQIIPTGSGDIASKTWIPTYSKMYGAFVETKLNLSEKSIYDITDNDLFAIEDVNAPLYIGAANAPELSFTDTIKVFKEDNNKVVMYERGNFLGMQHVADVEKMAPAMFVDTAFMRNNTYKPQYLLAVRHELIYHNEDCAIPGHPEVAKTLVDTVKASYLVNMVDSAKAFGLDKHNNPYIWENTSSFKLAFVDGYHTNDSLYFAKKDAKNAVVKDAKGNIVYDRIFLGNNENRIGKYAFRIVDSSTNAFIIETSYDGTNKIGYIKWLNGTPAVIEDRTQAEVFNMLETKETPTDNEGIETTEVSITAGTGQVTISNAQGKSVAISNILGQTLANTVLTSDNATISVPAGIVVVAVEGEAAAKVIVK